MATRFRAPAGPPWCFRGMPMVGCACIPTCRSTAAYRRRAMPIGGEGLEDRIQRSRDDRFCAQRTLELVDERTLVRVPVCTKAYFVNRCLTGFAAVGSAGEIANVSQVLQPGARLTASKSPYPLRPRKPCMSPKGKAYP